MANTEIAGTATAGKGKILLKSQKDIRKFVKKYSELHKEAFKGHKVSVYYPGDLKGMLGVGIVLEVADGTDEYGLETMKAIEDLENDIQNKVVVYWFKAMEKRNDELLLMRQRKGLGKSTTPNAFELVRDNKMLVFDGTK